MKDEQGRWCILRMSGGNTLPVARSLGEAGFDVWTPVEVQKRRVGRDRLVREISLPITPGIVFARDDRLDDLIVMMRAPTPTFLAWNPTTRRMELHGCPYFSVFRHQGKFPRIADRQLDPLRQAERRMRPRSKEATVHAGDEVRIPSSAFGGLIGVVDKTKGRFAMVRITAAIGEMMVEVEMCDLIASKTAA
ncbi:hypothetical protein EBBID32_45470 [Sphingobium indicum BiD32]|uniref:NusG-like N-terminal domain-containing protein n=1 Tax=Sphingobium indicum BiD32 TaxID=1301087 RepID=N1MT84_9SPHN|nr:hypothetical protein [Sphingobium indicum]CCW20176.1 hypothetical protein EBBID32_45470 [Sphingobium indicum BiD32]